LHYRGKAIREATLASLTASYGFGKATDVVVGGCSAGAAAVYLNIDAIAHAAPLGAKVRGMPDSGWFLPGDYARDNKEDYSSRMLVSLFILCYHMTEYFDILMSFIYIYYLW